MNFLKNLNGLKSKEIAFLLLIFAGWIGAHRFYLGKNASGILYLFTFGLFGFGIIIDLFSISDQVDACNMREQLKNTAYNPEVMNEAVAKLAKANEAMANLINQQAQNNQPPQQYSRTTPGGVDKIKMLTDLNQLLYAGIITQEEFDAEKAKILNS